MDHDGTAGILYKVMLRISALSWNATAVNLYLQVSLQKGRTCRKATLIGSLGHRRNDSCWYSNLYAGDIEDRQMGLVDLQKRLVGVSAGVP